MVDSYLESHEKIVGVLLQLLSESILGGRGPIVRASRGAHIGEVAAHTSAEAQAEFLVKRT